VQHIDYLIIPLLEGFEWFDESLQRSLQAAGWPALTRPESMVIAHVQLDLVRPADIARRLRLTRQAVHSTIAGLVERGLFALEPDPHDGRIKMVTLTAMGEAIKVDAMRAVNDITRELEARIGAERISALAEAFAADWGEPVTIQGGKKRR
jgi:DNA-binding MarR family transcriptional regulator